METSQKLMLKNCLDTISEIVDHDLKDVPKECYHQVELMKDHYIQLATLMDKVPDSSWSKISGTGVDLSNLNITNLDKFVTDIMRPVVFTVFSLEEKDGKHKIQQRSTSSLLVKKLRLLGIYMGPLLEKLKTSQGEVENKIKPVLDKEKKFLYLRYVP